MKRTWSDAYLWMVVWRGECCAHPNMVFRNNFRDIQALWDKRHEDHEYTLLPSAPVWGWDLDMLMGQYPLIFLRQIDETCYRAMPPTGAIPNCPKGLPADGGVGWVHPYMRTKDILAELRDEVGELRRKIQGMEARIEVLEGNPDGPVDPEDFKIRMLAAIRGLPFNA